MNEDEGLVKEGVQTTASLSCGSLKEGFSLNDKAGVFGAIEEEEGGDEEEERRQEQQRIQAFYRFYDDQDGDGNKRERQRKVQFCVEALSQVIQSDTDRSREISSSSSEEESCEEEDCEEEEYEEEECEGGTDQTYETEIHPSMDSDEAEFFHEDLTQTEAPPRTPGKVTESTICNTNHTFLFVLKLMLSLLLALVVGLIIIWWVSGAEERLHLEL
uniref:Uncharacterized protein n=1 Tax=Knipowitschia caucasica TaxID=637954 RepID=A0AAV2LYB3_KNICA